MKTIADLENRRWWRTVKVIYFWILIAIFIGLLVGVIDYADWGSFWWGILVMTAITLILQRTLYYVILGSFTPPKK